MFVRETDRQTETDRDKTCQAVHKLRMTLNLILLPPPPKRWDCRHAQPCLIDVALESDARALEMLGKHSAC